MHEEGRRKLKERLDVVHDWPSLYMFKFILQPEEDLISKLEALFPEEAEIKRKYSKTGKFVSLTIREVMISSDEVLDRYERASKIEGVMML